MWPSILAEIMSPRPDNLGKEQTIKDILLFPLEDRLTIEKTNIRIDHHMKKPKEVTYFVVLECLKLTKCYRAFTVSADVPEIYMHQFWNSIYKKKTSYHFRLDDKKFSLSVDEFRDALNMCPSDGDQVYDDLPFESEALQFIRDLDTKA